jgi:hypothetical protein
MTKVAAVIDSITSMKKRKKIRFTRVPLQLDVCLIGSETLKFSYRHCIGASTHVLGLTLSLPTYKFVTITRHLL